MTAAIDIQSEIVTAEMTKTCARELTDRIKTAVNDVSEMLWRAHQGKAWKALGYDTWKSYTAAEFRMSEQRSFQLLDFVEIKRSLSTQPGLSPANEKQARVLKSVPEENRDKVFKYATQLAGGKQPSTRLVKMAASVHSVHGPQPEVAVESVDRVEVIDFSGGALDRTINQCLSAPENQKEHLLVELAAFAIGSAARSGPLHHKSVQEGLRNYLSQLKSHLAKQEATKK